MIELWPAFILGLVGSFHCAGMCGPFALALPGGGFSATRFFLARLFYNLGRMVTYCTLGLIFGLAGKVLWLAGAQRWLALALGLILLAGLLASRRKSIVAGKAALLIDRLKRPLSRFLKSPSLLSPGLVGLVNGLLPCGLVYVACAAASATGNPFGALAYMTAFGAGTLPIMLGIGLSGRLIPFPVRLKLQRAVPVAVCLVAALLILRGLNIGLPGLLHLYHAHSPAQCCAAK